MSSQPKPEYQRLQVHVHGLVQGVGFRPFVHQLAKRFRLTGWVQNDGLGVTLEIQGTLTGAFLAALTTEVPPMASIDSISSQPVALQRDDGFHIRSSHQTEISTAIPPDSSVCSVCLQELFDPTSRYYRYPFINCSHCGPRYSITRRLPYDRANTSMADFKMCPACKTEYDDNSNRRFHAQPTACPACGPRLSMSISEILQRIRAGEILAIKGLGGFHLVCDASNDTAVTTLRQRKQRDEKPLAILVANLATARMLVHCDEAAAALLEGPQRPIVILPKHDTGLLAASIAPGLKSLGIMLPYTPLHYLLFHEAAGQPDGTAWLERAQDLYLVMTSANPGGEPLVIDNHEARQRLSNIADAIIDHDRDILIRCDDTVIQIVGKQSRFIRRARAYVPQAIRLPHAIPATLAVGGHLKNTICITRGDEAFVSQHIGDMNNAATLRCFEESIKHLLSVLNVTPQRVAYDLHPDFYSTRYAQSLGLPCYAVQHHHAHLAAVAAEHHIIQPAIGLALDGYGMGSDGSAWGGELLLLEGPQFQRLAHLQTLKQPGGDIAAREPWRMAAAFLHQTGRGDEVPKRYHTQSAARNIGQLLEKYINTPTTTSCGRLFDTASGILNIKHSASFEGQAAMLLESLVTTPAVMGDGWVIRDNQLDLTPLLTCLIDADPVHGANLFHGTLIEALCEWITHAALAHDTNIILLSGGCFMNQTLTSGVLKGLRDRNLKPYLPQQTPPNDGGISLGQAWIAGLLE